MEPPDDILSAPTPADLPGPVPGPGFEPEPVTGPRGGEEPIGASATAGADGPDGLAPPHADPIGPRALRRNTRHRMLGGVAAGVADYFGIDPIIIRVVFVVLAVFGGSGIVLYLAGWLLIPSDHAGRSVAQDWAQRPPPRRSIFVFVIGGVLAVIALSDMFSSGPWRPRWHGGFGFIVALMALALVVAFMAGSTHAAHVASRLRWIVMTALIALCAVVVVAIATLFSVEALSGVPLSGGIGASQWHPAAARQVKPVYRLAMGNLVVDLSGVDFRHGTTNIKASVGIGRLLVEVPPGPIVTVSAHSGLGEVLVFGQANGGFNSSQSMQSASPNSSGNGARIVLNAQAGVGQVQVVRAA